MTEINLIRKVSYDVEGGYLEKYLIVQNNVKVGRISMVEFQIQQPFQLNWRFLNEIFVEPEYRQRGIAKNALLKIGDFLERKAQNGILENAVSLPGAKKIYDDLGWKRLKHDNRWQTLQNIPVSDFVTRKTYDFVLDKLVKWQASSLN